MTNRSSRKPASRAEQAAPHVPRRGGDREGVRRASPATPVAFRPAARALRRGFADHARLHRGDQSRPPAASWATSCAGRRERRRRALARRAGACRAARRAADADVRADVHDADRRRARDGRPAHARSSVSSSAPRFATTTGRRSGASSPARRTTSTPSSELFASGALNAMGDLLVARRHRRDDAHARLAPVDRLLSRAAARRPHRQLRPQRGRGRPTATSARAPRGSTRS